MGSSRYRYFEKQVGLNSDQPQLTTAAAIETEVPTENKIKSKSESENDSVVKAAESQVSPPELSKQSLKCQWIVAESPFPRENFLAIEAPYVSTIYSQRESSAGAIVESVYQVVSVKPGHYWVFFSSFEYLEQIYELFIAKYPQVNCLRQQPGMSDEERASFLNYFKREKNNDENMESRLGMVTLGGIFGEGVDLVGESLIGAIIVGVGLPMLDLERNLIRDLGDQRGEDGFETAYVYPGMQRVVQAAGRVIRTAEDRGFVVLLDYRYRQSRFHKSLPAYWRRSIAPTTGKLTELIREFWTKSHG
jgi:DNA excision repair protein ERCC-2